MLPRAVLFFFLVLLLPSCFAAAEEISGRVVSVADGDTLTVLHGGEPLRIRLTEIDAPERGQAFGTRSRQSLSALCAAKTARVVVEGRDRYGRTLGRVWCGGVDTSAEQVRRGMAWVYDSYVTDHGLYAMQEQARAARAGLWTQASPLPPWQWRHGGRIAAGTTDAVMPGADGPILGNRRSRIYHLPQGCPSYGDISPRNRVPFASEPEALAAGYRRAGNCDVPR